MQKEKQKKSIKRKIGDNLYNFLKLNFSDDFLEENLNILFGQVSDLRFLEKEDYFNLKNILNSKQSEKKNKKEDIKNPHELLNSVGYILDDKIFTKNDYLKYKKYFSNGEILCKFNSYDATKQYDRLFWIIKKDIKEIKRKQNPTRQDDYGVSCCSIAIRNNSIGQICNRYNHTVSCPDNTFNSNLDNIIDPVVKQVLINLGYLVLSLSLMMSPVSTAFSTISSMSASSRFSSSGVRYLLLFKSAR
jgi:hypothetical protein